MYFDEPNAQYSFTSPRQQTFTFPSDMISRMLENPSSHKGLIKLYQTCKYFYGKRPMLIVDAAQIGMFHKDKNGKQNPYFYLCEVNGWNISGLNIPIWLTNYVNFSGYDFKKQQLPPCFRYSVKETRLSDSALKFDDFLILAAEEMVIKIYSDKSHIFLNDDNSKAASIAEILQHTPNIREFTYDIDEHCSALTKLNEVKLKNQFKLFCLHIMDVDSTFDLNLLCEFIMKNCNGNSKVYLSLVACIGSWFTMKETKEKLRPALDKLDPKWKKEAHEGLKKFFVEIQSNSKEPDFSFGLCDDSENEESELILNNADE